MVGDTCVDSRVAGGTADTPGHDTDTAESTVGFLDAQRAAGITLARVAFVRAGVVGGADHVVVDRVPGVDRLTVRVGRDVHLDVPKDCRAADATGVDGTPAGALALAVVVVVGRLGSADRLDVFGERDRRRNLDQADIVLHRPRVVVLVHEDAGDVERHTNATGRTAVVFADNDGNGTWSLAIHTVGSAQDPVLVDDAAATEM